MKKKILTILLCGVMVVCLTGCEDKTQNVKKYIESIGYQCNKDNTYEKYTCSLTDEDGNLNTFELPKGYSDSIKYVKTWKNGSYFRVRVGSYTQGSQDSSATYKEKYNNVGLSFGDLKKGKELTCGFYQELYQGKDELKICQEDLSLINDAKSYFEEIMEKSGVKLNK